MRKTKHQEIKNPMTVDICGLQSMLGVGQSTARKIAEKANAVFSEGRRKMYYLPKIRDYLEKNTIEQPNQTEEEKTNG